MACLVTLSQIITEIRLLIAACDSVLLNGSNAWAMKKAQEKSLDGTCIKIFAHSAGCFMEG